MWQPHRLAGPPFVSVFPELDVLDLEARGERLPKLVRLLAVGNAQGVQVLGAAHLFEERGVD
jgi:hypothetical protein